MRVPGRSSIAFLQGIYALRPSDVAHARRAGTRAAVALTVITGLVVVALIFLA
jgi:hypothetical protein